MIGRAMALALMGGGGVLGSQAPEFTTQYQQRLGGAVDELRVIVAAFDLSARAAGLTRAAALAELQGSPFLDRHGADMAANVARFERLSAQQARLQTAGSGAGRVAALALNPDRDLAARTWADFEPALPVTAAGLSFAVLGAALGGLLSGLLAVPFRRRPA